MQIIFKKINQLILYYIPGRTRNEKKKNNLKKLHRKRSQNNNVPILKKIMHTKVLVSKKIVHTKSKEDDD